MSSLLNPSVFLLFSFVTVAVQDSGTVPFVGSTPVHSASGGYSGTPGSSPGLERDQPPSPRWCPDPHLTDLVFIIRCGREGFDVLGESISPPREATRFMECPAFVDHQVFAESFHRLEADIALHNRRGKPRPCHRDA